MPKPTVHDGDYPAVLTLLEAARFLHVSERKIRTLAQTGKVPAHKVGRDWRFLREELMEWLGKQ